MDDERVPGFEVSGAADFDAEVEGLASVIALSRGTGSVSVAICNTVPVRTRVARALQERFPNLALVVVPADSTDAYSAAERTVPADSTPPDAVLIAGLGLSDPDRGVRRAEALNLSRELWRRRWPTALVFFVSEAELTVLIRHAPDLWSWKSHLFEFIEARIPTTKPSLYSAESMDSDLYTTPEPILRERVKELQRRLGTPPTSNSAGEYRRRFSWTLEAASSLGRLGSYREALEHFQSAVRMSELAGDPEGMAAARVGLAITLHLGGNLLEAERILSSVLVSVPTSSSVWQKWGVLALHNLAAVQRDRGDLKAARATVERSLKVLSGAANPEVTAVANSYSSLAAIRRDEGDFDGARDSVERAIDLGSRHLGTDHPFVAAQYSLKALIQQNQGDYSGARASIDRAIEINKRTFGLDHPIFATRLTNLAVILKDQGDLTGAIAAMQRAIDIEAKYMPPDHPSFASSYSGLAAIQLDQGDLSNSKANMDRAIAIQLKNFGPDHPNLAVLWSNLAMIQKELGDPSGARASIERAIEVKSKHSAQDHPDFATLYSNLATIQRDLADFSGARSSLQRAIEIEVKHLAPDHPTVATTYANLAALQKAEGDLVGARATIQRAIDIRAKHLRTEHVSHAHDAAILGTIEAALGNRERACEAFKTALAILRRHYPSDNHPRIVSLLDKLKSNGCSP